MLTHLVERPRGLVELAQHVGASPRATEALTRLLVLLEVCEWTSTGQISLTSDARALLSENPSAFETEVPVDSGIWDTFGELTARLRRGDQPNAAHYFAALTHDERNGFDRTMTVQARRAAADLVELVDLSAGGRLLDVGGGQGNLAEAFGRRWPRLEVSVLDIVAYEGTATSVRRIVADFRTEELPDRFDVVLLSKILHDWSDIEAQALLDRWTGHLNRDGVVIVHEEMLDPHATDPWPVVLDLFLVACLGGGRVRSLRENEQMLVAAGCEVVRSTIVPGGCTAIVARRQDGGSGDRGRE